MCSNVAVPFFKLLDLLHSLSSNLPASAGAPLQASLVGNHCSTVLSVIGQQFWFTQWLITFCSLLLFMNTFPAPLGLFLDLSRDSLARTPTQDEGKAHHKILMPLGFYFVTVNVTFHHVFPRRRDDKQHQTSAANKNSHRTSIHMQGDK